MATKKVKVKVHGAEKVMRNLNKELGKISNKSLEGMIDAAITIRRSMESTPPTTPVDLGNLRASFFTVTSKGGTPEGSGASFKGDKSAKLSSSHASVINNEKAKITGKAPKVTLGYTANYAAAVHENVEAKNWNRPGSGAKFLENAISRNKKEILASVAKKAKI